MNTPNPGRAATPLLLRPQVFFPALVTLIVISVLLTPKAETDTGGGNVPILTTHSTSAAGAKGLAETASRLGWTVSELDQPLSDTLSPNAIYAVLVPAGRLTAAETHTLLDRARAGAGVLVILGGGAIRDSLHLDRSDGVGEISPRLADSVRCSEERRSLSRLSTFGGLYVTGVDATGPLPADTVPLGTLKRWSTRRDSTQRTRLMAAIGVPLGRGRIAAVGDGRLLTNDAIRTCRWGAAITAVRVLEWLSEREGQPPRDTIVFDEFHHGYGRHASVMRTITGWLGNTNSGRTAAQLACAALLLLAASAPRPIVPLARTTIPRRSPLEHVSALAQAYEQVKATRTAARLLVQGLRRRAAPATGARHTTDEQFLTAIASRFPALHTDTERARRAMLDTVPPAELLEVATAIARIERSVRP